jgi:RimJ/RimL family protein N-acetyltransferase
MSSDPSFFRFSGTGPMAAEDVWARLLRHIGHWTLAGFGVFAIEEKASGKFVGEVGLCHFSRQLGRGFDEYPEATWSIAPQYRGRGFATEAARAALVDLESRQPSSRSVCLIHEENRSSLRVAEKLGYRRFTLQTYRGYPAVLLERTR